MNCDCFIADAFTNKLFSGNPAAVVVSPTILTKKNMLQVANELGISETAFLHKQDDKFLIRWFTPTTEIDLCGHATLASAHVLWENGFVEKRNGITFDSNNGILRATYDDDYIELDFPGDYPDPIDPNPVIEQALGITPKYIGKTKTDFFVVLESESDVHGLNPNIKLVASLPSDGLIVTALSSNPDYDFVSRVFAPNCGADEDPVCGAAHCAMGPYWSRIIGQNVLTAFQASARGGNLRVRIETDRVYLGGNATTFLKGQITL